MGECKPLPHSSSARPTRPDTASVCTGLKRRKLKLKATFESGSSHLSFKRSHPGAFNMGLIGSTAPPYRMHGEQRGGHPRLAPHGRGRRRRPTGRRAVGRRTVGRGQGGQAQRQAVD